MVAQCRSTSSTLPNVTNDRLWLIEKKLTESNKNVKGNHTTFCVRFQVVSCTDGDEMTNEPHRTKNVTPRRRKPKRKFRPTILQNATDLFKMLRSRTDDENKRNS